MTDLEMTKLCAEAMGYQQRDDSKDLVFYDHVQPDSQISVIDHAAPPVRQVFDYDPLNNDAQAMALVKRFDLDISRYSADEWSCDEFLDQNYPEGWPHFESLNRAIVSTVAKLQEAKCKTT